MGRVPSPDWLPPGGLCVLICPPVQEGKACKANGGTVVVTVELSPSRLVKYLLGNSRSSFLEEISDFPQDAAAEFCQQ